MKGSCCNSIFSCHPWFVLILLAVLCGGLVPDWTDIGALGDARFRTDAGWVPWALGAGAASIWGLWSGFRRHRQAEIFAVGLFSMLAVVIGLATWPSVAVLGSLGLVGAAVWGAAVFRNPR